MDSLCRTAMDSLRRLVIALSHDKGCDVTARDDRYQATRLLNASGVQI
jgi:hypothetical protein